METTTQMFSPRTNRDDVHCFDRNDCPDIAPKKLKAVLAFMCSTFDDKNKKGTFFAQRFSNIKDVGENTGAEDYNNNLDALFNETDKIGFFRNGTIRFAARSD